MGSLWMWRYVWGGAEGFLCFCLFYRLHSISPSIQSFCIYPLTAIIQCSFRLPIPLLQANSCIIQFIYFHAIFLVLNFLSQLFSYYSLSLTLPCCLSNLIQPLSSNPFLIFQSVCFPPIFLILFNSFRVLVVSRLVESVVVLAELTGA